MNLMNLMKIINCHPCSASGLKRQHQTSQNDKRGTKKNFYAKIDVGFSFINPDFIIPSPTPLVLSSPHHHQPHTPGPQACKQAGAHTRTHNFQEPKRSFINPQLYVTLKTQAILNKECRQLSTCLGLNFLQQIMKTEAFSFFLSINYYTYCYF